MSNGVEFVEGVTGGDVNAMINFEDTILKELIEVCENIMVERKGMLNESLTNAGEIGKMSFGGMKSLSNVVNKGENAINNREYRILESHLKSSENVIERSDDVFGETHADASFRSVCLIGLENIGKSEITYKIGENPTDGDGSFFNPRGDDTNQNLRIAHTDASISSNKDEIVEGLTNTVANIIVSNIESDGTKEGTSFNSENNESFVEYQENSDYSFAKLEERKKPIEIKKPGKMVLSNTENGESSVLYEPDFYTDDEACELFDFLRESTEWLDKSIVIHGIEYPQPRLVAWYGPLPYSYSGTTLEPAEMPDCVLGIKRRVEDYLKGNNIDVELNSVLLNLYRNNKDSVSWHSDDEFTMGVCPTIASISLGETRRFEMRPKISRYCEDEQEKKRDEYFAHLHNGSLIIMDGCMQEDWQHRVPKEYHDRRARINLTFRTVYEFKKGARFSKSRKSRNFEQKMRKRKKLEAENHFQA